MCFVVNKERTESTPVVNGGKFSVFTPFQLVRDQQLSKLTGCLCFSIRVFKVYLSDCNEAVVHKADKTHSNWSVYSSGRTN